MKLNMQKIVWMLQSNTIQASVTNDVVNNNCDNWHFVYTSQSCILAATSSGLPGEKGKWVVSPCGVENGCKYCEELLTVLDSAKHTLCQMCVWEWQIQNHKISWEVQIFVLGGSQSLAVEILKQVDQLAYNLDFHRATKRLTKHYFMYMYVQLMSSHRV